MAQDETASGTFGVVRIIGMLGVMALAMLAAGFVLDIIPRESFQEYAAKTIVLGAIGAVAIAARLRMGRHGPTRAHPVA